MHTSLLFDGMTVTANIPCRMDAQAVDADKVQLSVSWDEMKQEAPCLTVEWMMPVQDMQYMWYPNCGFQRSLRVDWMEPVNSRISCSAPVYVLFNQAGENRMTVALSDALTDIDTLIGVHEESGEFKCSVHIPLDKTGMTHAYSVTLLRNTEKVSFAAALRHVSTWWETACGYKPMPVPESARQPLYSCWYSFHQHTVADEILAECKRARAIGFDTVIVDDGWQTADGNRGYGYCGDWQACEDKIPDMRALVDRVHRVGMKFMLWYSVPFVGYFSAHWEEFKGMLLREVPALHCGVLDPRYPQVRAYLQSTYEQALKNWDLDGFKLDFIDDFLPTTQAPAPREGMDYIRVEDAVLALMQGIMKTLRAIKPDILIEFRQHYVGPAMRTFGNMFRVGDCPNDPLKNRLGTVDLRLLSGNTAIHSDMLMWNAGESARCVAGQILNVIFAVPQISVKLDRATDEQLRQLRFWMDFAKQHRALLAAPMEVMSPQHLYPLVRTALDGEEALAVYDQVVVPLHTQSTTYLMNAAAREETVLRPDQHCAMTACVYNCMGELLGETVLDAAVLWEVCIPVGGYAVLKKKI